MNAAPDMLVQLSTEQLEQLLRKCVREELAERGYAAADETMTKAQVAKLFGVTARTVSNWMARDALPYRKGHGGHIVFTREDVARWAREQGVPLKLKAVG